jgi:antitoxin ParD1/3/4
MLNVSLTPEAQTFIQKQLSKGKYRFSFRDASRTTDEILLAGLNLLAAREESEQERYAELRRDIEVGLAEAGRGELINGEEVFDRLQGKLQQQREMTAND